MIFLYVYVCVIPDNQLDRIHDGADKADGIFCYLWLIFWIVVISEDGIQPSAASWGNYKTLINPEI